jgi:hypothetical protein
MDDLVQTVAFKIREYYDRCGSGLEKTANEIVDLCKSADKEGVLYTYSEYFNNVRNPSDVFIEANKKSPLHLKRHWLIEKPTGHQLDILVRGANLFFYAGGNPETYFVYDKIINWFVEQYILYLWQE